MATTTTSTSTTPVWAVRQGESILHEGDVFAVESVDTDIAANGGFVAVRMGGERLLFAPAAEVAVVESLEDIALCAALLG